MVATPGPANLLMMIGGAQKGVASCIGFILGLVCGKVFLNLVFGLGFGFSCEPAAPCKWSQICECWLHDLAGAAILE